MPKSKQWLIMLVIGGIALAGCATNITGTTLSSSSPTAAINFAPPPTNTPRPTASPTDTVRPTASPTDTVRPTATPTATPTPQPITITVVHSNDTWGYLQPCG